MVTVTLRDIKGLGPVSINDLSMHGIWSVEDLANALIADITRVPGFGAARAAQAKQAAADLLGAASPPVRPAPKRARSARKPVSDATSPRQVHGEAPEVLPVVDDMAAEASVVLIEDSGKGKGKGKQSKEKKSTKGKKDGRGKKKDKKKKDKKK